MHRGGELSEFNLVWESWGELNTDASNAILVMTGLSPGAHAASSAANGEPGWWEFMIGPNKPLDTNKYFVICANSLGSCKGSTGPASLNPQTNQPYRLDFPELSLEDIANAMIPLLQSLGIERLHTLVGPSMGGMSALALLLQHPGVAGRFISISSALHAEPFAIAIRSLQRDAITGDPEWEKGYYGPNEHPESGMRMARKIGMLSYRSAQEWRERFKREPAQQKTNMAFGIEFAIQSYLQAHAEKFVGSFDPNAYLYLSRAMDWFDAFDYGDNPMAIPDLESALVLGVETDILFPIHQQRQIASLLEQANVDTEYQSMKSLQGHDAFLVDEVAFATEVARYMNQNS